MKWQVAFAAACLLLLSFASRADEMEVPALRARVNDYAGVLSREAQVSLENELGAHEKKTTNQVVILTLLTIGNDDIFQFSQRVFETWRIGQEKKDNGLLIVMVKDRLQTGKSTRIHTGRGLGGAIPDAVATRVVVDIMKPKFIAGKFLEGFRSGLDEILPRIAKEYASDTSSKEHGWTPIQIFAGVAFGFIFFILLLVLCHSPRPYPRERASRVQSRHRTRDDDDSSIWTPSLSSSDDSSVRRVSVQSGEGDSTSSFSAGGGDSDGGGGGD